MANVRRTSLNLDLELVERAKDALGTTTTTETVHKALAEVWRREAAKRMAAWRFDHMGPDWVEKLRREQWAPEEHDRGE
jgi:hypothetical protein